MPTRRNDGQAVPEYMGIVVVLAVLLAALALVVSRTGWLDGGSRSAPVPTMPAIRIIDIGSPAGHHGGRFARVRRVVTSGVRLAARGAVAAGRGFGHAAKQDLEAFLRDPTGTLLGGSDAVAAFARDPVGSTLALVDDARAYADELRSMRGEDAYVRLMEDLGSVAEDVVVSRGKGLLRRRMLRTLRERMQRPGRPGDAPPEPTQ